MWWSLTLEICSTMLKLAQTAMKTTSCTIPVVFGNMMSFKISQKIHTFNEQVSEEGILETTGNP